MKASINPPSVSSDTTSYQLECQFALEPSLRSLADKAEDAGWDRAHILLAMMAYASERITQHESALTGHPPDEAH